MNSKEINEKNIWQDEATTIQTWKCTTGKYLLESGLYSDVEFVVKKSGEQQTFKAHKLELIRASSVFETMFYGSLPQQSPIVLDDVEPGIFKKFLKFVYYDTVELTTVSDAWNLYEIAHRYSVKLLLQEIRKKIILLLREDITYNISSFEYAEHFGDEELKTSILCHITRNIDKIVKLESFLETKLSTLLLIVKQPKLKICEIDLFQALNKYHVENCGKSNDYNDMMKKIIREIRFLRFTLEEFVGVGINSPLLTDSEKIKIIETMKEVNQSLQEKCMCSYEHCGSCRKIVSFRKRPSNGIVNSQDCKMPRQFSLSMMERN